MYNDYRQTHYEGEPPNVGDEKKRVEESIRKTHPTVRDLHPLIRSNSLPFKDKFINAYNKKCAYCGVSLLVIDKAQFEIDHFIPKSDLTRFKSKSDAGCINNLVLACRKCNRNKKDYLLPNEYLAKLNPDKSEIRNIFYRDEKYYIQICTDYVADKVIESFYNQLRLGDDLRRLDYLLMSMIGLAEKCKDNRRLYGELNIAIEKLRIKRNIGIKPNRENSYERI